MRDDLWERIGGFELARFLLRGSPVVPAAADYFQLLRAELATIVPRFDWTFEQSDLYYERLMPLEAAIKARLARGEPCSLVLVFEFEDLLIRVMPEDRIRTKAWSVRASYTAIINKELLQKYTDSKPPEPKTAAIEAVRADVQDTTAGLHWWYVSANRQEAALRRLKAMLAWAVGIGFVIVLVMTLLIATRPGGVFVAELTPVEIIIYVFYAGVLGAITSTIRRIQPVAEEPIADSNPLLKAIALEQGNIGVLLSTAMGGIFAIVLALALAAGMADFAGTAAPRLGGGATVVGCCGELLYDYLHGLVPSSPADFAKLMVWSFAAGFSERLVPDILDRVGPKKAS